MYHAHLFLSQSIFYRYEKSYFNYSHILKIQYLFLRLKLFLLEEIFNLPYTTKNIFQLFIRIVSYTEKTYQKLSSLFFLKVLNVDPQTGKILRSIELPAKFITSVAFGGRNFEDLYVTSAENEAKRELGLQDGSTFVVTGIGVRGLPANEVSI